MEISDTTPDNGAVGQALETNIDVVFDVAADPDSIIGSGHFIVVTSASKLTSRGPGFEDFTAVDDDLLDSEVFTGIVDGVITTSDNLTFTFNPSSPLEPNKTYRVILGTEIVSKTIGAITPDGGNTSTGSFTTKGPYTGDDDTYTIAIVDAGALGTATFTYTPTSTGLVSDTLTTDRSVELEDGVFLKFTTGNFVAGDTWTIALTEGDPLDDIYEFSFTTGSSTHVQVSEETPSIQIEAREVDGLRRVDSLPASDSGTLALVSILPEDGATRIPTSNQKIVLTFNKEIDPASLTTATLKVLMQSLPFDEVEQNSNQLRVTAVASGKTVTLTFTG